MRSGDKGNGTPGTGPYRIATVAEMTDVPEPTLRAWERRYGVPAPERTTAGYRLYDLTCVEEVRTMRSLCDEGMAAAQAAEVVRARRSGGGAEPWRPAEPARSDLYETAVLELLDAIERFDDAALEERVRRLPLLGGTLTLIDRVVTPTLRTVGDRWHKGELTVAQERMASQRLGMFLRALLRLSLSDDSGDRVVCGCFADDEHELGLLVTSVRLAVWGMRPLFLGGRMPPVALRSAVTALAPRFVALSVTVKPERARARELVEQYAACCSGVPWLVGGAAVGPIAELVTKQGGLVAPSEPEALRALLRSLGARSHGSMRSGGKS